MNIDRRTWLGSAVTVLLSPMLLFAGKEEEEEIKDEVSELFGLYRAEGAQLFFEIWNFDGTIWYFWELPDRWRIGVLAKGDEVLKIVREGDAKEEEEPLGFRVVSVVTPESWKGPPTLAKEILK